MNVKRLFQLLVLGGLILALGIIPALGNTVTMTQDHSLALGLSGSANLGVVGFAPSSTGAFAQGFSTSPSGDEGPLSSFNRPTASVSGTYFSATSATIGAETRNGPYIMNQGMVAQPPAPYGTTSQQTQNFIALVFQADSDGGDATVTLNDSLSNMVYGAAGVGNPVFITISASTYFTASIFSASNPSIDSNAQTLLDDFQTGVIMDPITGTTTIKAVPNFSGSISPISPVTFNLLGLSPDELVYLDLSLSSTLDTESATVPVPPTVWLFGSGLVGLWGVRRRLRRS